ncbi:hypothetical protein JCM14036_33990 [Desulfotomaculum defluvii]
MLLKNQKGIALISVLIILTITSLLGTTVWYASSQETLASERVEDQTQAFYFAQAGVEMAISYIKYRCEAEMAGTLELSSFNKISYYRHLNGTFKEEQNTKTHNVEYDLSYNDQTEEFTIKSVGIVRKGQSSGAIQAQDDLEYGITKGAILSIIRRGSGGSGGPIALFANEIERLHATVIGNVVANNSLNFWPQGEIDGDLYIGPNVNKPDEKKVSGLINKLPSAMSFPLPEFPQKPELEHRDYFIPNKIENGFYDAINITEPTTIEVGNDVRRIYVNELIINNDITINGSGKLEVYAENISFGKENGKGNGNGNSKKVSINGTGDANGFILYYSGNEDLNIEGTFVGSLYTKTAGLSIGNENSKDDIHGSFIIGGTNLNIKGDMDTKASLIYAPYANLDLNKANPNIIGTVVVNSCSIGSGNKKNVITSDDSLDIAFFNSLNWESGQPPSLSMTQEESWRGYGEWKKI